jgi:hypothetical protein
VGDDSWYSSKAKLALASHVALLIEKKEEERYVEIIDLTSFGLCDYVRSNIYYCMLLLFWPSCLICSHNLMSNKNDIFQIHYFLDWTTFILFVTSLHLVTRWTLLLKDNNPLTYIYLSFFYFLDSCISYTRWTLLGTKE